MTILDVNIVKLLSFVLAIFSRTVFAEDPCLTWFQSSGVKSDGKGCLISCDLIPKDMSSFDCSDRCDEFCKAKKCQPNPYWKNKLKNGAPKNWNLPTEQPANWTDLEMTQMMTILNQLPDQLESFPLDGIYRMKKSVDIINPGSTSDDGKEIAIYDRAFHSPFWSLSSVVTHELGHMVFQSMGAAEKQKYIDVLGWNKKGAIRPGEFVSSTAKDDVNEDFAENFSFFLLNRDILKSKVPKAYGWLVQKFTANFKLKDGCKNENN